MNTQRTLLSVLLGASLFLSLQVTSHLRASLQSECAGKIYPSDGCPDDLKNETENADSVCGNYKVEPGEDCDLGQYNGQYGRSCSSDCHYFSCGDGIVSPDLKEECEPDSQEVYGIDPDTGDLIVEKEYMSPSCGVSCTTPVCNGGVCTGGCERVFYPDCSSGSSFQSSSAASSSESSVASESSSSSSESSVEAPEAASSSSESIEVAESSSSSSEELHEAPEESGSSLDVETESSGTSLETSELPAVEEAICGDGQVGSVEECDDGNQIDGDSCSNDCKIATCGDGILQNNEDCDDGNTIDSDDCSNDCRLTKCGDSVVEADEQCDDGNKINEDGCSNKCRLARCGDGNTQNGEWCDDGNQVNDDGCTNTCMTPKCGDSIKQKNEECDGGIDCTDQCRKQTPGVIASAESAGASLGIVGGGLTAAAVLTGILLYRLLRKRPMNMNIDDIPLDQIENPLGKW